MSIATAITTLTTSKLVFVLYGVFESIQKLTQRHAYKLELLGLYAMDSSKHTVSIIVAQRKKKLSSSQIPLCFEDVHNIYEPILHV